MDQFRIRIGFFVGIALSWSLIWFSQKSLLIDLFKTLPQFTILLFGLVPTLGLLFASFLVRRKLSNLNNSFAGGKLFYSLIVVSIPILCLGIIGIKNIFGIQENLFGIMIGIFTLTYAFLEEYGWRGYLQEDLEGRINKWFVYVTIGLIWYLWHWYFLREGNNPQIIMIPILIASSAGIGEISRSTKSILICAAFHGIANILFIFGIVSNNLSATNKIIILIACLVVWIPIVIKIERENAANNN